MSMNNNIRKLLWMAALAALAALAIFAIVRSRRSGGGAVEAPAADVDPGAADAQETVERYRRIKNPRYLKSAKAEQEKQRGILARLEAARNNLREASAAGLKADELKVFEDAVAREQEQLDLSRARFKADLMRELWFESHPRQAALINTAREQEEAFVRQIDDAEKRLAAARESGAAQETLDALRKEIDTLGEQMAKAHEETGRTLKEMNKPAPESGKNNL